MKWYNINNSINNALSISIDEEIGSFGVNAKDFIEEVKTSKSKDIELVINSGGGSVFEAFAIYDFLKNSNLNVSVKIEGVAASAASVLALAGDSLPTMTENSVIMIHNAWMPVISMQGMNSEEIREFQIELEKDAKLMDSINLKIAKIYSNATGLDLSKVQDMMSETTWIFAEEAKEFGFVSEVLEGKKIAAFASVKDLSKMGYKNIPKNYVNQLNNVNMSEKDEKGLLKVISNFFASAEKEVEATKEVLDVDALKAELSASIKAELSKENEELANKNAELEAELEAKKVEVVAKVSEVEAAKKEVEKAKSAREVVASKEDVIDSKKVEEVKDALGDHILSVFKNSGYIK